MCQGKCSKNTDQTSQDRLTAIMVALATNPKFIDAIGARYVTAGVPSMADLAKAMFNFECCWNDNHPVTE